MCSNEDFKGTLQTKVKMMISLIVCKCILTFCRVFQISNAPIYRASHKMFQTLSCIVRPVSTFLSADELFPKGACAAISVAMPNLKLAIWKLSLFNRSSAALVTSGII